MTLLWFDPGAWMLASTDAVNGFTADLFWQVATSPPVLVIITALAVASFAVAHFDFVGAIFPQVRPFFKAASITSILAFAALLFLVGFKASDNRSELQRVKSDLAFKEFQLGTQEKTARDAEALQRDAEAAARAARSKLSVYEAKFGDNPEVGKCPPRPGVVDWVHDLQRRRQDRSAEPAEANRGLVARLRKSGAKRR